jgi:hypothetical protein
MTTPATTQTPRRVAGTVRALVGRDCHKCRAVTIRASAKYGGIFENRCSLGRDRDKCKRRIYTYAELMTANDSGQPRLAQQEKP